MADNVQFLRRLMMEFADAGHSIFSPSGSAMWLSCPGSLIANLLEEDKGSWEAAEGTVAHGLAEQWLKTGQKPVEMIGRTIRVQDTPQSDVFLILIDEVMLDWVEDYVNWCLTLPGDHYVEQRVYFTELMPVANPDEPGAAPLPFVPQGGTADHTALMPGAAVITDFKYGRGVFVPVEDNTQGVIYALAVFFLWDWLYDFQEITIRICQPRLHNWGVWTLSRAALLDYAEVIRAGAKEAWQINAPRRVSKKGCQWCKVKADCTAFAVVLDSLEFADLDRLNELLDANAMSEMKARLREEYRLMVADSARLSDTELVQLLAYRHPVELFFKAVDQKLTADALDGKQVEGKKLTSGRSTRQWRDQDKIVEHARFLGLTDDQIYNVEVISPAQMEEKLRKEAHYDRKSIPGLIKKYVYSPPGRPTLVDATDPRPELSDSDEGAWDV